MGAKRSVHRASFAAAAVRLSGDTAQRMLPSKSQLLKQLLTCI